MDDLADLKSTADLYRELGTLIEWGAPADERKEAAAVAERYRDDPVALHLLTAFYSFLPADREEAVLGIGFVRRKEGFFLLAAQTAASRYLYLVSAADAIYLGREEEGIWDADVLEFFGWPDNAASKKALAALAPYPDYRPAARDPNLCPVCFVGPGETHILGCPVEICPWCGGQLTHCDCRFQKLGRQRLDRDAHIEALAAALEQKGRIPFEPASQSPVHPAAVGRLAGSVPDDE